MRSTYLIGAMAVMATVTYIIRALPMVLFRKKIKNTFVRSFLYYVPYTVLAAMTFPAVFFSTGSVCASVAGCVVALVLAYVGKSLLTVALSAATVAFITEILFDTFYLM